MSHSDVLTGLCWHVGRRSVAFPCPETKADMQLLGWCDYLVCDPVVCPPEMHKCRKCNIADEKDVQLDFGCDFEGPDESWI